MGTGQELRALCKHWRTKQYCSKDKSDTHGIPLGKVLASGAHYARFLPLWFSLAGWLTIRKQPIRDFGGSDCSRLQ